MSEVNVLLEEICQELKLGNFISSKPISGGRIHKVWQLKTGKGSFALKVLNEKIIEQKVTACAEYERSERVARAFADLGVPARPALFVNDNCVHLISGKAIMIYDWVEGITQKVGSVDALRAEKMGEVLGTIHGINLDSSGFIPVCRAKSPEQWSNLIEQAKTTKHPVGVQLEANTKNLMIALERAMNAAESLKKGMLLSHGDLDQQNVIWLENSEAAIIDWESVSLQNPAVELLNLCLDWSGFPDQVPNKEAFLACFNGYQKSNRGRTALTSMEIAFDGEVEYFLSWLYFSLTRLSNASADEADIALTESLNALRSLCLFSECEQLLSTWFS